MKFKVGEIIKYSNEPTSGIAKIKKLYINSEARLIANIDILKSEHRTSYEVICLCEKCIKRRNIKILTEDEAIVYMI